MNKNFVWTIFGTIFWTILLTIFGTTEIFAENKTLPEDIKTEFVKANINLENVGLYIQNLNKAPQKILINYNGEKLFKPASVMKLVTTYAGILNLGTDFVWQTKIYADNKVNEDGILNGNLYIFGGGDPNLTFDELYKLLTKLFVEYNVKRINGNIIFNNSLFNLSDELQNTLAEDFDGYKFAPYNVIPKPLIFDLQTLNLLFYLDAKNQIQVKTLPQLSQLVINTKNLILSKNNKNKNKNKICPKDWEDNLIYTNKQANKNNKNSNNKIILNIAGSIPENCLQNKPQKIYVAALNNFENNVVFFNSIWHQLGGKIFGKFIEENQKILLENLHYFFTYNSKSLGETIKPINKFSNNVMTRLLYLSLPLKNSNNNTFSLEKSNKTIKEILAKHNINFDNAIFDNGAGLSRKTKFSLYSLNALLIHAWNNKKMPEFIQSLPIFGEDGTLKKRYANSIYKGQAHLKTGHINGVKNVAGYYQTTHGNRYTISFFINDENVATMQNYYDIIHLIFDYIESNDK